MLSLVNITVLCSNASFAFECFATTQIYITCCVLAEVSSVKTRPIKTRFAVSGEKPELDNLVFNV